MDTRINETWRIKQQTEFCLWFHHQTLWFSDQHTGAHIGISLCLFRYYGKEKKEQIYEHLDVNHEICGFNRYFRLFWFVHNGIHPQACNQINQANRCVILWNWACFILRQTHILTSIMWYAQSICSMYWITTSIFQLANKWPKQTWVNILPSTKIIKRMGKNILPPMTYQKWVGENQSPPIPYTSLRPWFKGGYHIYRGSENLGGW